MLPSCLCRKRPSFVCILWFGIAGTTGIINFLSLFKRGIRDDQNFSRAFEDNVSIWMTWRVPEPIRSVYWICRVSSCIIFQEMDIESIPQHVQSSTIIGKSWVFWGFFGRIRVQGLTYSVTWSICLVPVPLLSFYTSFNHSGQQHETMKPFLSLIERKKP